MPVVTFTATETVRPITTSMEAAVRRLQASFVRDMVAMGQSADKARAEFDKMTISMRQYTDAEGKRKVDITASNAALKQMAQVEAQATAATRAALEEKKRFNSELDKGRQKLGDTNRTWLDHAKGIFAAIGVYRLASMAMREIFQVFAWIKDAAIGFNAQLEQSRLAFTNLMGSSQAAEGMLTKLFKLAAETPFEFTQIVDATKRLMAYGIAAEDIEPTLIAIGNAAAGLATGSLGIDRMSLALGQMAAKGKVQGQELRQLGEAGIKVSEVMTIVGKKYGMTLSEIMDLQEQGKVKAEDFLAAFREYTKLKFGDMMYVQSKTFTGAMTTISDNMKMVIAQGFEPLFKAISKSVVAFAEFTKTPEFFAWSNQIRGAVIGVMTVFTNFTDGIKNNLAPTLAMLGVVILAIAKTLGTLLIPKFLALGAAIGGVPLLALIAAVGVAAAIMDAAAHSTERLAKRQEELAKQWNLSKSLTKDHGDEIKQLVVEYDDLRQKMNTAKGTGYALEQQFSAVKGRLIELREELAAENFELVVNSEAIEAAAMAYLTMVPAVKQSSDAIDAWRERIGLVKDFITDISLELVKSGDMSLQAAGKWRDSMGVGASNVDKLKEALKLLGDELKGKSTEVVTFIGMTTNAIINSAKLSEEEQLALITQVYDLIAQKSEETAEKVKNDWKAVGESFKTDLAQGLAGIFGDIEKFTKAEEVKIIDPAEIQKEQAAVQEFEAQLLELQENIRRRLGISVVKDLNWTQPLKENSAQIQKLRADETQLILKIQEHKQSIVGLQSGYAGAGEAGAAAQKKMSDALGEYMIKWVLAQQQQSKLSKDTADQMLADIEKNFGLQLSQNSKMARAYDDVAKKIWDLVDAGKITGEQAVDAIGRFTAEAAKSATPIETLKTKAGEFVKSIQSGVAEWRKAHMPLEDIATTAEQEVKPELDTLIEKIKTLLEEKKLTFTTNLDKDVMPYVGNLAGLIKSLCEKKWEVVIGVTFKETPPPPLLPPPPGPPDQGDYGSLIMGQTSSVGNIIESIQDLLNRFKALSIDPRLQEMADVVDAVVGAFRSAIDAFTALAGYTQPARAAIDTVFADMVYVYNRLFADLVKFIGSIDAEKLNEFAGAAESALSAFGTAVEAFSKMKDVVAPTKADIDMIYAALSYIVEQIIGLAGKFDPEAVAQAKALAETIGAIGDALGSVIEPFKKALDFPAVTMDRNFANIADAIRRWVAGMIWLSQFFDDEGLKAASALAETAGKIGDALSKVIDPFKTALEFPALPIGPGGGVPGFSNLADAIKRWLVGLSNMFADLEREGFPPEKAEALSAIIETIGTALNAIVDPLKKAAEFPIIAAGAFSNLGNALRQMITKLVEWKAEFGDSAAAVEGFAELLGKIVQPFQAIVTTTEQLMKFAKGVEDSSTDFSKAMYYADLALVAMMNQLMLWSETLLAAPGGSKKERDDLLKALAEYGKLLADLVQPFQAIISTVSAADDLAKKVAEGTFDLAAAMVFVHQAVYAILDRLAYMKSLLYTSPEFLEPLKGYAQLLADIISPFQMIISVVSAAYDLAKKTAEGTFDLSKAIAFIDEATRSLWRWLAQLWGETISVPAWEDMMSEQAGFAELLSKILSPIQSTISIVSSALDLYEKLGEETTNFAAVVSMVDTAARELWKWLAQLWGETIITPAWEDIMKEQATFAELLNKILSPIQSAISIASSALDLYGKLGSEAVNFATVISVVDTAVKELWRWLAQLWGQTIIIPDWEDIMKEQAGFAELLGKILSPMQTAVSIVSSVVDLNENLSDGVISWAEIVSTLDTAVRELWRWLAQLWGETIATPDWEKIMKEQATFSELLNKILSPISTAVSAVSGLVDLYDKLAKKTIDWGSVLKEFGHALEIVLVAIGDLAADEDVTAALKKVPKEFSDALQSALGPIKLAVETLEAIQTYTGFAARPADAIPAQVQALADDVESFMRAFAAAAADIEISDDIKDFGAALDAIIGPVKSYIDTFYWLWRYTSIWSRTGRPGGATEPEDWIPPQFQALAGDLAKLVKYLATVAQDPEVRAAIPIAKQFSEDVKGVTEVMLDLNNFLVSLTTGPGASSKIAVIDTFIENIRYAIQRLVVLFEQQGDVAARLKQNMGIIGFRAGENLVQGIIDGINSMMPQLLALVASIPPRIAVPLGVAPVPAPTGGGGGGGVAGKAGTPAAPPVTVNIYNPVIRNDNDIDKLANQVAVVLGRQASRNQNVVVPSW